MSIDLKTALTLATQRYFGPTVVVLLVLYGVLFGGVAYVWTEYKELQNKKDQTVAERKSLNDEILLSEKTRATAAIALIEKKAELDKREFVLQQLEGQNKERLAALQQRAGEYEAAMGKLQQSQSALSLAQRQKEAEDKIENLMSQFTAMGVDLSATLRCGDTEGQAKFNTAKGKFTEIYTFAEAHGLVKKYGNFFFHNQQNGWSDCQK